MVHSSHVAVAGRSVAVRASGKPFIQQFVAQTLVVALMLSSWPGAAFAQTAVTIQPPNLGGAVAGAVPGGAGVSSSGAATYSVPIKLPPGTAGVTPALALSYGSQGGESLLGVGWAINGLSSVTRCARTLAVDGSIGRVGLDADDRYCLDGQRLLLVSGTYGASAEYRTEIDGISRITSTGSDPASGPSSWKVETRSGQILSYGTSVDSFVEAQGTAKAMSWAVKRVEDRRGNYYVVDYSESTATGEHFPYQIRYTANDAANLAPNTAVHFEYEAAARPDPIKRYAAGSLMQVTKRLGRISAWTGTNADGAGGTEVSELRIAYTLSLSSQRSLVDTLTLCDGANHCLPATSFAWQQHTTAHNNFSAAGSGVWTTLMPIWSGSQGIESKRTIDDVLKGVKLVDLNGDGRTDLLSSNEDGTWKACLSTGSGFDCQTWNGPPGTTDASVTGDFNGDGRTDILLGAATGNGLWLSNGAGFDYIASPNIGGDDGLNLSASATYVVGDFDGDGRDDVIVRVGANLCSFNGTAPFTCTNQQTLGFFDPKFSLYLEPENQCSLGTSRWTPFLGDFNGDHRTEVLQVAYLDPKCKAVWPSTANNSYSMCTIGGSAGAGTVTCTPVVTGLGEATGFVQSPGNMMGDLNGDGLQDFVLGNLGSTLTPSMKLCLSTGNGTAADCADYQPTGTAQAYVSTLADFDGDGRPDVLQGGNVCQVLGNSSLSCVNYTGAGAQANEFKPMFADFNGDGKTDLAFFNNKTGTWRIALADGPTPDLLQSVTNGLGQVTQFDYSGLNNPAVYTGGAATAYPKRNVNSGTTVVSQMRVSNAQGDWFRTDYQYEANRTDLRGRGALGFEKTRSIDRVKGVTSQSTVSQDFPFTGMALESRSTQTNGVVLSLATQTLASRATQGGAVHPYVSDSTVTRRDLNNAPMTTQSSHIAAADVDPYGNVLASTESTQGDGDSFTTTTVNQYEIRVASWLVGLLKSSAVTKAADLPGLTPTPPALTLSNCSTTSGTTSPSTASFSCTLSNTSPTAATGIAYSAPSGTTASGPASCAAGNVACGTVTVTTSGSPGHYVGTLQVTPTPAGGPAAASIDLTVNPTPAALAFDSCSASSPSISPTPASFSCVLRNNGQSDASGIAYASTGGGSSSGPTSCPGGSTNCGTVTLTSGTTAGTYSGTLTATPTAGSAASSAFSITVNPPPTPPSLSLACNTPAATVTPTPVTMSCTIGNLGQTAASVSYSVPAGFSVSGPGTCAASTPNCGTVQVTTPTGPATYTGTLTATPNTGTAASAAINLTVKPMPPALTLSGCTSVTPSIAPAAATLSCTLGNSGQTAATVSYATAANTSVSGPTSCPGSTANCGVVTVSTATAAGGYSGTLSATPNPTGAAASVGVSLAVNTPPALAFSNCSAASSTVAPTAAVATCTLSNSGQTAASGIGYAAPAGTSVSGPTSCAAGSTCGTVTVTSGTAAASYSGGLSATPSPAGSAASTTLSLTVNAAVPNVSVTPSTLAFGNVPVLTQSAAKTVTVTNTGTGATTLSWAVASTGGAATIGKFVTATSSCVSGGTLAAGGASCTIGVIYSASCAAGNRAGTLTIQATGASTTVVNLSATSTGVCN